MSTNTPPTIIYSQLNMKVIFSCWSVNKSFLYVCVCADVLTPMSRGKLEKYTMMRSASSSRYLKSKMDINYVLVCSQLSIWLEREKEIMVCFVVILILYYKIFSTFFNVNFAYFLTEVFLLS